MSVSAHILSCNWQCVQMQKATKFAKFAAGLFPASGFKAIGMAVSRSLSTAAVACVKLGRAAVLAAA